MKEVEAKLCYWKQKEHFQCFLAVCRREGKSPFFLPHGLRGWHTKPSCVPPGGRNGADNQCSAPYFCSLRQTASLRKYQWVLPTQSYKDLHNLLSSFDTDIIDVAEKRVRELAIEKAKRLERP